MYSAEAYQLWEVAKIQAVVAGLWQMIKGGFVSEKNLITQLVAVNTKLHNTSVIGKTRIIYIFIQELKKHELSITLKTETSTFKLTDVPDDLPTRFLLLSFFAVAIPTTVAAPVSNTASHAACPLANSQSFT
jgi:hypothetical protein